MAPRVHAPELVGAGGWLNTGGQALSLAALRGKVVLLDFWTFCCANCLHVLDELRPLEERFADVLVVVGVHSPKFTHEADHAALADAVARYGVTHPVLDDPALVTWRAYTVAAWPTLVLVDPEGYVVTAASGEGHGPSLEAAVSALVEEHEAHGTLRRGGTPAAPGVAAPAAQAAQPAQAAQAAGGVRFPARALALGDGSVVVADTGHHRLAVLELPTGRVRRCIGSGDRGHADGAAERASFAEPQGLALLPPGLAAEVGYDLVVADTANHLLRGVSLQSGQVRTVAGTGRLLRVPAAGSLAALEADLSSPWDVAVQGSQVVVAMAGCHQLFGFDPLAGRVDVLAGTGREGLLDGAAEQAALAQPSALAVDGDQVYFLDAETSALRVLAHGEVRTLVGSGLFDFGLVDGTAPQARLQHPLGLRRLPDGSLLVADTYNGALRRFDPAAETLTTVATGLAEPTDTLVDGDALWAVESSGHRLTRVVLACASPEPPVVPPSTGTARPVTALAPRVRLEVRFSPPPGRHLDDRDGPPTRLRVAATPEDLLIEGAGTGTELVRDLTLAAGRGVLSVTASAASCDLEAEHPACHLALQDWGVPVEVGVAGAGELSLVLMGSPAGPAPTT